MKDAGAAQSPGVGCEHAISFAKIAPRATTANVIVRVLSGIRPRNDVIELIGSSQ
jgi:hypothetical protein